MVGLPYDMNPGGYGLKMKENEPSSGLINIWDFIGGLAERWMFPNWNCAWMVATRLKAGLQWGPLNHVPTKLAAYID